jgi:hypothetical protein
MGVRARLYRKDTPLVIGAFAVAALFGGVYIGLQGLRDDHQVVLSCADYEKHRPDSHWLKLTDCEYDVDHYAVYGDKSGGDEITNITKVYLPVKSTAKANGKSPIVVVRNDRDTLEVFEAFQRGHDPSQAAIDRLRAKLDRPIEGIVASHIDSDNLSKADLKNLDLGIADDFVMLDEGSTPHLLAGLLLLVGGFLLSILAVVLFVVGKRYRRDHPPPPRVPPPPTSWPPPRKPDPQNPIAAFERPV